MWSRMAKMPTLTADLGICLFCPNAATVFYCHPLHTTFVHMIGCFPHMSRGNTRPCKNSFENQAKGNGMIYATTCCGFYSRLQQLLVVGFWHPWDWNFPIVAHHFGGEVLLGSGLQFVPVCIRHRQIPHFLQSNFMLCFSCSRAFDSKRSLDHGMGYASTRRNRPQLRSQLVRQRRALV